VRSRVVNHLLSDQIHNSTVDVCLRLLVRFSRAYGVFNIESHTPLSINLPQSVYPRRFTQWDYTLTILPRSLVWKEPGTTRQSSSSRFPCGASENVFPFHNLRTYGHFLGDPTPSLVFRPCLLGFSQPFRVRRSGRRPHLLLYDSRRIMRSKQRFYFFK